MYQEPFQNMQRGAAITLNISESNKSGSAGTISIGHVQTGSRREMGLPKTGSEKSPHHSSGASDDNNSADNLKLNEPATLQLVRKGRTQLFITILLLLLQCIILKNRSKSCIWV